MEAFAESTENLDDLISGMDISVYPQCGTNISHSDTQSLYPSFRPKKKHESIITFLFGKSGFKEGYQLVVLHLENIN